MRSSMAKTGICWDNSQAETFFSALKNERVYRTTYATKERARKDIIRYIEGFYNSCRRHSALNYSGRMKSTIVTNSRHGSVENH